MMMQVKDPAIKLFGKTITFFPASAAADCDAFGGGSTRSGGGGGCGGSCSDYERASSDGSEINVKQMDKVMEVQTGKGLKQKSDDGSVNGSNMCEDNEIQKMGSGEDEIVNGNSGGSNVTEEADSKEKTPLKKPDEVLPCPRCNSMDTKFCYYNNYNVLQPRHFCKGCQRYWTAGGAMRNVPVGAGRRKSKNAAFQNRYLTISDILHASGAGTSNGFAPCQPGLKCGSATVSGSTGSKSNVTQMPFLDPARNTTHKIDEGVIAKACRVGDINSSGSCVTASNEKESTQHGPTSLGSGLSDSLAQIPCIPTWPHPWNAAIPPPTLAHLGFPLPFVPPSYWACTALPNTWNAPWLASQSLSQTSTNSKPPVLGKHSRDETMIPEYKTGKLETARQPTVLTPKTLRIDHPEEAAKSSIWETLGIKNETVSKGGLFRDLKWKETENLKHVPEHYAHFTSNPAALSRSLNFQEVS